MNVGCAGCLSFPDCGGLDELTLFGCHPHAVGACTARGYVCPHCDLVRYWERMGAAKRRALQRVPARSPEVRLPPYLGLINHPRGWKAELPFPVVALATWAVVGGRGKRFGVRFSNREELLRRFGLRSDVHILLVSVADDSFLEPYWRWGKENGVPERLASLGVVGITVPNYSFFEDAQRFHHLYNLLRHDGTLYELAAAGLSVIPHYQALTTNDQLRWVEWFKARPGIGHVCREFQCGNKAEQIEELARLQDAIGRSLHPIIVGGAGHAERLRTLFEHFTIVNSTPFSKAIWRRRLVERDGKLQDRRHPTKTKEELGMLLRDNLATYARHVARPVREQLMLATFEQAIEATQAIRREKQGRPTLLAPDDRQIPLGLSEERRVVHLPVVGQGIDEISHPLEKNP